MTRAPWIATGLVLATVVAVGSGPGQSSQTTANTQQAASKSTEPSIIVLRVTDVRPDMMSEFVALQKSDTIPGLKKAGLEWRDAWRSAVVGSANTIAFLTPAKSFADFDGDPPMKKALGDDGYRTYMDKVTKLIGSSRVYILRTRPDLGYQTEASSASTMPPKLGVLAEVEVAMGKQPDFESILKAEWVPALKKANIPSYMVTETMMGGPIGQYHTFTPITNFAQLEKGHPVQQALGEAAFTKLMARMGPNIRRAERTIIRYDEELSFRGTAKPKTESQ
jgi:hypothetical protein